MQKKRPISEVEAQITIDDLYDETKHVKMKVGGKWAEKYGEHTLISKECFDKVNGRSLTWNDRGYVRINIKIDGSFRRLMLSRYLINAKSGFDAEHLDCRPWNNTLENITEETRRRNDHNKRKRANASSPYYGVSKLKMSESFVAYVTIDGNTVRLGSYKNEIHAAEAYDTYINQNREKFDLNHRINFPDRIEELKNREPYKAKEKTNLTGYLHVHNDDGAFCYMFQYDQKVYRGTRHKTPIECAKEKDKYVVDNNLPVALSIPGDYPNYNPEKRKVKLQKLEINLESEECINILKTMDIDLESIDPNKDIIGYYEPSKTYVLIEKEDYDNVKYFTFCVSKAKEGYVKCSSNGKPYLLSRFILKDDLTDTNNIADHLFSNRLDNRRRFLKANTTAGNASNVTKSKTLKTTSKYIGVHKGYGRKWNSHVRRNHHVVFSYNKDLSEEHAARRRDYFLLINFPLDCQFNFPDWNDKSVKTYWKKELGYEKEDPKPKAKPKQKDEQNNDSNNN